MFLEQWGCNIDICVNFILLQLLSSRLGCIDSRGVAIKGRHLPTTFFHASLLAVLPPDAPEWLPVRAGLLDRHVSNNAVNSAGLQRAPRLRSSPFFVTPPLDIVRRVYT